MPSASLPSASVPPASIPSVSVPPVSVPPSSSSFSISPSPSTSSSPSNPSSPSLSSSTSVGMTSRMWQSSDPSKLLEMPQERKEWATMSSATASHAADTQLMASCLVGCFKLPILVLHVLPLLLHSIHNSLILSLKGLLMETSIGCASEVQPPERITIKNKRFCHR